MQYKRWYDRNEALKQIMEIMEQADEDTRRDIANDIIQLVVENQYDIDNFIQVVNKQTHFNKNRWYDEDETMRSAVEMLKNIGESEKRELFKEILTSILNFGNE